MDSSGSRHHFRVLLVEDNPADAALLGRMMRESAVRPELTIVADGVEAMSFLKREGLYPHAKTPHLVLLDLNLPRKSGMEVLAELKADAALKIIPVIVLTSSASVDDVTNSYALGANGYLRKALSLDGTRDLFKSIENFWMSLAILPTSVNGAGR